MLLTAGSAYRGAPGISAFYAALRLALAAVMLLAVNLSQAATVGQVEFAQGLVSAQQRGQTPRFLSKGDTLQDGDVINTGAKGFAVILFPDGAKMTLRPNTTFAIDQYNTTAGQESIVMRLLKGGLRAITGVVGKAKPESVRISTPTSTIGIRGTSFDARICEADCAKEIRANSKPKPVDPVVARVAAIIGSATVTSATKQTRSVVKGAALYTGESIRTEKGGYVVLAFRDETRVTVASESEFKLENVRFAGDKADSGNFVVRLLRGTARTFTGLLAKRDPKAVQVNAGTSTIGIRGTGFDMRLVSECSAPGQCADSVYVQLWDGAIDMNAVGQTVSVPLGRAVVFNGLQNRVSPLDRVPDFFTNETAPRPDQVPVDASFFSATAIDGAPPGVYVNVRDGHVEFLGSRRGVDLGRSEAGYLANGSDTPVRLTRVPSFMSDDPIPAPEDFDEKMLRLLETLGDSSGGLICEI